jgi:hypothetical protein
VSLYGRKIVLWRHGSHLITLVTYLADKLGTETRLKQAGIRNAKESSPSSRHGLGDPINSVRNSFRRWSNLREDSTAHTGWFKYVGVATHLFISEDQIKEG